MSQLRNDLGIAFISLVVEDPDGDGCLNGRAYLFGPDAGQVQKGSAGHVVGVCEYSAPHGGTASFRLEGFGVVETSGAVAIGSEVFVEADGRVGTTATTAKLGTALSATDAAGEKLSVDLSTKNSAAPAAAV